VVLSLSELDIRDYLSGKNDAALFAEADKVRREMFGDAVYLRGILEFSNYCRRNCRYCGLRRDNREIQHYRLTVDEILDGVAEIAGNGLKTVVLQTGEDPFYSAREIARIITAIKSRYEIAVTLSLGEHSREAYRLWREAGADRYLLRIETFNRVNYARVRPQRVWEKRLECLATLRDLDYEIGSGIMVGLPGDQFEDIVTAVRELTQLQLHMIGTGPFIAHPNTPFAGQPSGNIDLTLRVYALLRILNPLANIPSTSAMESAAPGGRLRGLQVGANVIMPSFTPWRVRELYNIYPGKNIQQDIDDGLSSALAMIARAGYRASFARGDSPLKDNEKVKIENEKLLVK